MGVLRALVWTAMAIVGGVAILALIGSARLERRAVEEQQRGESQQLEAQTTINEWMLMECNVGRGYASLSCDDPVFRGAQTAGIDLNEQRFFWFNVCDFRGRLPALYTFSEECIFPRVSQSERLPSVRFSTNFVGTRLGTRSSFLRHYYIPIRGVEHSWSLTSNRVVPNAPAIRSESTRLGAYGYFLYELAVGKSAAVVGGLFTLLVIVFSVLACVGERVRTGRVDDDAYAIHAIFLIVFVWLIIGALHWQAVKILADEQNYLSAIFRTNALLTQHEIAPGQGFRPIPANLGFGMDSYPPTPDAVSDFFATLLAAPALIGLHLLYLWLVGALVRGGFRNILYGYYHVFIPSRHARAIPNDGEEPLGRPSSRPIEIPSVADIVRGSFDTLFAPFRILARRNQARKARILAEALKAQAEELESETELFDQAVRRESARMDHGARKPDSE